MKFTLACALTLVVLSTNGALSSPSDFCKHKTPTHGRQLKGGSCSTTIQGEIPGFNDMSSVIITSPPDHKVLSAFKPFHVEVLVSNLQTGFFSDPDKDYYALPQELNSNGLIKGHLHVTIQRIDTHRPPDPRKFAFFKGLQDKAKDGRLRADVVQEDGTPGLPPGKYRICTISSSLTHQPVIMPVAKRGAQDDCIRIKVKSLKDKKGEAGKQKDDKDDKKGEVGKQKDDKDDTKDEVGKQNDDKPSVDKAGNQ